MIIKAVARHCKFENEDSFPGKGGRQNLCHTNLWAEISLVHAAGKIGFDKCAAACGALIVYAVIYENVLIADLKSQHLEEIISRKGLEDIKDNVVLTGYVVNSDLPYIYNGAFTFLYTSLRESFGIPLLEGMACGTPVITSNTSSMPEIGGKDGALINPESSDEIAAMMLKIENNSDFRNEIISNGLEKAKLFSWKNTAINLLKLYKEVYKEC